MSNVLSKVVGKTRSFIKDSFHFREFIKHQEIPEHHILASLDVKSLYTNIPIDLAMTVVEENWEKIKLHTKLPKEDFIYALKICLNSTFFQYKDEFFQQISGVAMGGPVSAVVANLVMEYVEGKILNSLKCKIGFYKRFMDDCITCFPQNLQVYILEHFNAFHPKIQFTIEVEKNKSLDFLDMTLDHKNGPKIRTKWYQKPTSSGRYLSYFSEVPHHWKVNVVNNLFQRAIRLSDKCYRPESMKRAYDLLLNNEYPPGLLKKLSRKCEYRCETEGRRQPTQKIDPSRLIKVPYVRGLSEKLKKCWQPYNFQPVFCSQNSSKQLFSKLKSSVPPEKASNVVYKIDCKNCEAAYIGVTKRYLGERIRSHKYDKNEKTALHQHEREKGHEFNFDTPKVLIREENTRARLYHEAIQIKRCPNAINYRSDTDVLGVAYNALF